MRDRKEVHRIHPGAYLSLLPETLPDSGFSLRRCLLFGIGLALAIAGLGMMASAMSLLTAGTLPVHAEAEEPPILGVHVAVIPAYLAETRPLLAATETNAEESSVLPPANEPTAVGTPEENLAVVLGTGPENVRVQALGLAPAISGPPREPQIPSDARAPAPATQGTPLPLPAAIVVATPEPITLPANAVPRLRVIDDADITFYDCREQGFCGRMANGQHVYEGAAACSYDLPLGTRFYIVGDPTNRIYRCDDRGLLRRTWVDIFWYDPIDGWRWQELVGRWGTIVVIDWGDDG